MNKLLTSIISFLGIAFLMVMVSIPPAYGAIAFVGQASSTTGNSTNPSVNMTYTGGNSLIVACSSYSNSVINTVTDGINTYVKDAIVQGGTSNSSQAIFHASSISSASTTVTVTCNGTGGTSGWNIFVNEYSGLSNVTSTLVDASSSAFATGPSNTKVADPGPITTNNANDLIFGANIANVVPSSVNIAPNFTLRGNCARCAEPALDFDQIVSLTGTYDATSTWDTTGAIAAASVAYKQAAAVVTTSVVRHKSPILVTVQ